MQCDTRSGITIFAGGFGRAKLEDDMVGGSHCGIEVRVGVGKDEGVEMEVSEEREDIGKRGVSGRGGGGKQRTNSADLLYSKSTDDRGDLGS